MQRNFLRAHLSFIVGWLLATVLFAGFLLSYGKAEGFIILNPWHTPALDVLFRILTLLGDGWFIIAIVVLLFFIKRRPLSILILSSYAFSGLIVQILKNYFPSDRPKLYFENHFIHYPYFLDNITLHTINSFPSGHTTSVFALAAAVAFTGKKKSASLLLLLGAMLVGYSRIYLGQHFPEDVISGAAIGVFSSVVCYIIVEYFYARRNRKYNEIANGYLL